MAACNVTIFIDCISIVRFEMQAVNKQGLAGVRVAPPARRTVRPSRSVLATVRAAKVSDGPVIAIVGVTGAVGQEFLRVRAIFMC
jgi:hypothetical protein